MGKIIPAIHKSKQMPKALCWPVQYSHVEACLIDRCDDDLQLSICFWEKSGSVNRNCTAHPLSSPSLLDLGYDPAYKGFWKDTRDNRYVVRATVFPIPVATWKDSGITKAQLRQVLIQEMRRLTPKRLPSDRWTFHTNLILPQRAIECIAVNWTGIREEEPVRLLVPIERHPSS